MSNRGVLFQRGRIIKNPAKHVGLVQRGYYHFVLRNLFSPDMEIWVGTKNVVFCSGYSINVPTFTKYAKEVFNLQ